MNNAITHERNQHKHRIFDTFAPSASVHTVVSPVNTFDTKNNFKSVILSNHFLDKNLKMAQGLVRQNNLPQAEIYLQRYLALNKHNRYSRQLLKDLRQGYGLSETFTLSEKSSSIRSQKEKFLLIKAWGCGFWSEVHHLLGQLLLSELTCRTPIILWGRNCLFRNDLNTNVFSLFFQEISSIKLRDIKPSADIFPSKWNWDNIYDENISTWYGDSSRLAAQFLFDRPESLVGSDFYSTISSIIPWIDKSSKYFAKTDEELYSGLFRKYLKPAFGVAAKVESFWNRRMAGKPWVAVHVRGSDKSYESIHLAQTSARYFRFVDMIVELNPTIGVFVLSDSVLVIEEYKMRYGNRLVCTDVTRSASNVGVHHMSDQDGIKIGEEVLLDTLLAVKCNYFIGNQESNVSLAISSMRNWPKGRIFLIGEGSCRSENLFLHDRSQTPVFVEISSKYR